MTRACGLLPRIYADPGRLMFAKRSPRGVWHAAPAPEIEQWMPDRWSQPMVARTLCGHLARLTAEHYRDLWPDSVSSCTTCWRAVERRRLPTEAACA